MTPIPLRQPKPLPLKGGKEDLEFEVRFFEGLARRDPSYVEALQILGDAYTRTGQWAKGLHVDEQLAKLCPTNPLVFYNLACSFALMNRVDEAIGALTEAVKLGYDDARWLSRDPDLKNLRDDSRFRRLREDISKKRPERS